MQAINKGQTAMVQELLSAHPGQLHAMNHFGTWLHYAAQEGRLEIVQLLVSKGVELNRRGGTAGGNALNEAASDGKYEVAKYLLAQGASMDVDEPERNPLFGAILSGHKALVRLLLQSGADATVRYTGQRMKNMGPVEFALERGQKEIAEIIRQHLPAKSKT